MKKVADARPECSGSFATPGQQPGFNATLMRMRLPTGHRAYKVTAAQAAALALLGLLLIVARRPDMLLAPQFWGEDAAVFFPQAEAHGASVLFIPFAGYLYLLPRLVAWAAVSVPVVHVPTVYAAGALIIVAAALGLVLQSPLTDSPGMGLAMVLAVAAAPYSGEIWGNLVNTHWFSALVILAACLPPRTRAAGIGLHVLLPFFVLTGPSALILLPVVAVASAHRTDRWRWVTLAIVTVGAVLTAWTLVLAPRDHGGETFVARLVTIGHAVLLRYQLQVFGVAFAAMAWTAWRAWREGLLREFVVSAAACLFAVAVCVSGPKEALYSLPAAAGRYIFVPWIAASWLLIHALFRHGSWQLLLVAAVMAGSAAWQYLQPARPDVDWARAAECLESRPVCQVTVTPYPEPLRLPGRGSGSRR